MPTCLFCVKSSNSDQKPIRHHKYQKRSGLGWFGDRAHTAELDLARGQPQTSSGYPVQAAGGGLGKARADGAPASERRFASLSVAFAEGGEMPFSQRLFFLTH